MKRELPKPHANMTEYQKIMEAGFAKFPQREENYKRYLEIISNGGQEILDCMPVKMDYEVATHCNFRCTMCAMSEIGAHRPPDMTFAMYKKSLDQQYGLIEVKLQGLGEPLLNPDFFKMVDYTVDQCIWVRTVTNASLLHLSENYKRMIDSKIGEIQVSVDGATKKTFENIRKGSNFEQVVKNCRLLNEYAETKGEQWRTSCWMLVQQENVREVESLLELACNMKFTRLTYSIAIGNMGLDKLTGSSAKKEVKDLFTEELADKLVQRGKALGMEVTFWDGKDKYRYDAEKRNICPWIFGRAFISGDMRILPCCVISGNQAYDLGSAEQFADEWSADKYRDLRMAHLNGKIPPECRNCYQ